MTFSEALKYLRKQKPMTLRELADASGTSSAYLSQLETGKRNPPKPEILQKIVLGLVAKIGINELVYGVLAGLAGYSLPEWNLDDMIMQSSSQDSMQYIKQYATTESGSSMIKALVRLLRMYDDDSRASLESIITTLATDLTKDEIDESPKLSSIRSIYAMRMLESNNSIYRDIGKLVEYRSKLLIKIGLGK
jgi:transcriptional regulator with XRE-family HTH domain